MNINRLIKIFRKPPRLVSRIFNNINGSSRIEHSIVLQSVTSRGSLTKSRALEIRTRYFYFVPLGHTRAHVYTSVQTSQKHAHLYPEVHPRFPSCASLRLYDSSGDFRSGFDAAVSSRSGSLTANAAGFTLHSIPRSLFSRASIPSSESSLPLSLSLSVSLLFSRS